MDERYEFIRYASTPLADIEAMREDIEGKRWLIAARAKDLGGGYLMIVDADDLVSSDLVAFVGRNAHPHGYLVTAGYVFDAPSGAIAFTYPLPAFEKWPFDRVCGTSALVRFAPDELPHDNGDGSLFGRIFGGRHKSVRSRAAAAGRPLAALPFRAAVYVRGTGENFSFRGGPADAGYRFHRRLSEAIPAYAIERTAELDREFNLAAAQPLQPDRE